ncbi:MAG: cadmium-translocating P-type ATPase [Treponema sp.]|jgi:Cd2+/Zn2+-exporting ATPase|nr:cadmium-translocating P-type ATPase [Treponema sp.]
MEAVVRKEFTLEGLCCPVCAGKIEEKVGALNGVRGATVDFTNQLLTMEIEDRAQAGNIVTRAVSIVRLIESDIVMNEKKAGAVNAADAAGSRRDWRLWIRRVSLGLGALLFAAGLIFPFPRYAELVLFLVSYLLVGGDVIWRALKNISRGQVFDENFLMGLATVGAFAIGEYPEAVAVMLFYQVGEAFQNYAVGRSRKSIADLMDIRPDFANLQTGTGLRRVSPEEVNAGDVIVVKPGEKIPLDGTVIEGYSALDTSALTGESLPRDVATGSEVLSGSINKNGLLTISVSREFGETTVSRILRLVQNAGSRKAKMENFITKFARYYTPAVVFAALILAVLPPLLLSEARFADWLHRALIFLVVSCPCALVISIPLSFFGGIGGASRRGILVKGSNYLEALNSVDTVVFDKTGTLTRGSFSVTGVESRGVTGEELLYFAAHAESHSSHPIAKSILRAYGKPVSGGNITGYEEIAGQGVRVLVDGKTVLAGNGRLLEEAGIPCSAPDIPGTLVYLAIDGAFAGYIVISDELKRDSREAIAGLKALGVKTIAMFTGDSRRVAEKIGEEIGIDTVYAELLPHQKVEKLEELERRGTGQGKLVFVGDGINDAPVLARADVGIAMGGVGSDAAIEAADVVLMTDEPSKIAEAIGIAKRTRTIVWQNIVFALGVKLVILTLGALGIATMWEAVFGDVGVAVIATLNAMRALKKQPGGNEKTRLGPAC